MSALRFVVVTTTVSTKAGALHLARAVVRARLAACAQCWPIVSVYRWRGKVETTGEFAVACKTRSDRAAALQAFIRARHAYELPELLVTPILRGLPGYLQWLAEECAPARPPAHPRPASPVVAARPQRRRKARPS
jgi:periplasmic divalent cation tolerance protein